MKKILSISLICLFMLVSFVNVKAEGNVTYDGDAQDFIFQPGSEYSPTDLFPDFKNLMPGDSVSQIITINNKSSKEVKIRLYMRSLGADEDSKAFLSNLILKVDQVGNSNLFDAPADQTAQLTDWVYLGTIYSGGKIDLNVTVEVPASLGNEFQDEIGYLDWEFMVEELPVEPTDPIPSTGDNTNIYLICGICGLSLLGIIVFSNKKKQQCNK